MTGSKDLSPSTTPFFPNTFFNNQFTARPQWPSRGTNLSGRTAIVTGSNVGLGYEASMQLLGLNLSHLIVAVRSLDKGETAASTMRKQYPKATIEVWQLDMTSYESVQAFAKKAETLARIDIVILNAGLAHFEYHKVERTGHEETLQVNYLSTVLLVLLLLPILKAKRLPGQPAHLTIASAALTLNCKFVHRNSNPLFPALDDPKKFQRGENYEVSKVLAQMFLWNLVDYVSADDIIINLADPAFVRGTAFARDIDSVLLKVVFLVFGFTAGRTPKVGASCYIDAVVNKGKESHGCFLMSWNIHPFPTLLYTPEGKRITQRVWDETLAEFEFVNARGVVEAMKGN
ncbi:hypothetical protein F4859DRAFT_478779 [Xylaria cf. heliscus]|nr:hypothetical protein F4859DRAFT_478779 [Xylaria cf. heliscus]